MANSINECFAAFPLQTVKQTAETCKKLKIPFPEVNIPSEDLEKPKDFYVFKGQNTPTVIHIPLFNVVNPGGKLRLSSWIKMKHQLCSDVSVLLFLQMILRTWRKKYLTFQDPYCAEMITDLMEVAGENISNNREKLKEQIAAVVGKKKHTTNENLKSAQCSEMKRQSHYCLF